MDVGRLTKKYLSIRKMIKSIIRVRRITENIIGRLSKLIICIEILIKKIIGKLIKRFIERLTKVII